MKLVCVRMRWTWRRTRRSRCAKRLWQRGATCYPCGCKKMWVSSISATFWCKMCIKIHTRDLLCHKQLKQTEASPQQFVVLLAEPDLAGDERSRVLSSLRVALTNNSVRSALLLYISTLLICLCLAFDCTLFILSVLCACFSWVREFGTPGLNALLRIMTYCTRE